MTERLSETFASDLEAFRASKDHYFRTSPDSPLEDRAFTGLNYYSASAAWRVQATLEPFAKQETVMLETSTGDTQPYLRVGRASFAVTEKTCDQKTWAEKTCELTLYRPTFGMANDAFFVPFRDATSGLETYGAGRYLEADPAPDGYVLLDFNKGYHPYCAYSARYRCPLPPAENHLNVPIRAGEKL